jgi:hypothetical protein
MKGRPPRDLSLKFLTALRIAPATTADLARFVHGRRDPANAAYIVLRRLERLGVVRRVNPPATVARGTGKPGFWWSLTTPCAQAEPVEELPFTPVRSAA